MLSSLRRITQSSRPRRTAGQAMVEYVSLTAALLIGTVSLVTFAPDSVAALTIYIRGFYLVLAMPLG
ncbi:hypothetical protein P2318_12820 [Myxococcaceae bacterium GXIMD 01537]